MNQNSTGNDRPADRLSTDYGYEAVAPPIISLSFAADEYMSLANTRALHGLYANAPQTATRTAPADIGEKRIGHFGFFRAKYERALWRERLLPALG